MNNLDYQNGPGKGPQTGKLDGPFHFYGLLLFETWLFFSCFLSLKPEIYQVHMEKGKYYSQGTCAPSLSNSTSHGIKITHIQVRPHLAFQHHTFTWDAMWIEGSRHNVYMWIPRECMVLEGSWHWIITHRTRVTHFYLSY